MAKLRERLNISKLAIQHSWLTIGFWLALAVAGVLAFSSLKYALFPDITFPVVVVNATAPTETTTATEAQLTRPIEAQLEEIAGVGDIRSTTYPGRAVISLSFDVGTNLESSAQAVEEALQPLDLPSEATTQVIPLNLNESAVVSYALQSDRLDLAELVETAETDIIPQIEDIPGVLRVDLLGTAAAESNATGRELPNEDSTGQNLPTLVRFNGEDALAIQVIKQGDSNTLDVVRQVERTIQQLQTELPEVEFTLATTQAEYIREATQATIDALVQAVVIAVAVIFVFLRNWRATLITALAIPTSLLGTAIVMAIYGFNLETITLLALALVIGIIVDDAIVDVENIIRHIEEGETPRQAAIKATREIGLTVSAATLTIVAVFLPVAFMGGTIGQFFKPFGLTISAAVLFSLLVARTLSPVLSAYWLKPHPKRRAGVATEADAIASWPNSEDSEEPLVPTTPPSWLEQRYDDLLSWSLDHRGAVMGIAILSFVGGIALIPLIPKGFIPQLDRGEFNITYAAPLPPAATASALTNQPALNRQAPNRPAPSIPSQARSAAQARSINPLTLLLNQSRQVAIELEDPVLQSPDVASVFTVIGMRGEPNRGRLQVQLRPDRTQTTAQVQEQFRTELPRPEGVTTSVEDVQFIEVGNTKPLQVALVGEDLDTLQESAQTLQSRLEAIPGFVDVTTSGINQGSGTVTEISRLNGQRVAYVTANLTNNLAIGDATDEVSAIAQEILPASVTLELQGDSASSNEVFSSFAGTLALAVVCMLGLLWLLFGRLLEPLVVGLTLPLCIVGAMLALLLTQSDFGMVSLLGLIFLLGLLDKNALLLMDYINQLQQAGMDRREAILKTGQIRLRPILMTTASTILGMLPLALGLGAGAELRQPMAVAIMGGLFTSTLLSLIVVPVLYTLLEDGWYGIKRRFSQRKGDR